MKSLKNIYFSDNFYIKNNIFSLNEAIITQKDFLGKLVSKIKERPMILGIIGVNNEQDIYDKLEENYSKKSDSSNRTKEYYHKLYIDNYIKNKQISDTSVDKSLVDSFEEIEDLGEKFNKIYERLSSKEYFEKKYREKVEKLESDRVKRVEILNSKGVKIPVNDLSSIEFNQEQFDKEWDIESRLFVIEGNIGLEIFKVVELFNISGNMDKKSEKSAEEILQKQLKKYEGLDGGSIEFREIKKLYDYMYQYINSSVEVNIDQCILAADFYLSTVYMGLDEEEKKLIDSGEFDFSEIMQRMYHYNKYKVTLSNDKFSLYKDCELIYEDDNFILVYPKTNFAFNDTLKYFNANVVWCTQKISTWLYYNNDQFVCILNDKRLKPGNPNYLISFKVAKTGMIGSSTGNSYQIGEIAYEECCDYNNNHMDYDLVSSMFDSSVFEKIKKSCVKFANSYYRETIDGKDFIENSLESFVKMNRVNDIFKICYELCIQYIDIVNFEEFIVVNMIRNIFYYAEQYRKLNLFYEITNRLFVNLPSSYILYLKLYETVKQINEESIFINLVDNLLSMCKISNIHSNFFITYKKIYELLGGNVNITYEDKIIIFSNALKTNNKNLFMDVIYNINQGLFFVEEFKESTKKQDIFKSIYSSKMYIDLIESTFIKKIDSIYVYGELLNRNNDSLNKFSPSEFLQYIFYYNINEIIKLVKINDDEIKKLNNNIVKSYLFDNDFFNNFNFLKDFDSLIVFIIDYIKKCTDVEFNNFIFEEFNKLKNKIISKNILIITQTNEIESIFNNISFNFQKDLDNKLINFLMHQFINKIFNNKTLINVNINKEIISEIKNATLFFVEREKLNSYSETDILKLYKFLIESIKLNLNDVNIKNSIFNIVIRYYYMKNSSQLKTIKQEIFSSFNNENKKLFDLMFLRFGNNKNEIFMFLNDVINVMLHDQTEKEFFEKFFIECFNSIDQCKELLMDLNNNINKFDSKNFEYFINFVNNDIINKVKTEKLIKTYIKLLLN
jgi:hypothetical protein